MRIKPETVHRTGSTPAIVIRTCRWFSNGRGSEAEDFYCRLIPGSRVERIYTGDAGHGTFSVIDFTLGSVPYRALDAGPMFRLTEAVSLSVATDDQAETDRLWTALTENGGEEGVCNWLKDRYGVSWRVYPMMLTELTMSSDKRVSAAAMTTMMRQKKIVIREIEAAVHTAQ